MFSTGTVNSTKTDFITRIDLSSLTDVRLYPKTGDTGTDLKFDLDHPIDAIGSFESGTVQKVYWVDGKNQPRIINIAKAPSTKFDSTSFNFIPTLKLQENVYVEKLLGASGMFAPGVIQYAFTYYRKYGQESNIFYVSPLLYISYKDRGQIQKIR